MAKKKQKKATEKKTRRRTASQGKDARTMSVARNKALAPTSTSSGTTKAQPKEVKVTAAKGRPMLTWVGKRPLSHVTAFPAQRVERHDGCSIVGIPYMNNEHDRQRIALFRDLRSQMNQECWKADPQGYPPVPELGGLLFHGDNKEVLAHLLASGYRGKVNLVYIDPPFDSGADYVRKVALRGPKGAAKLDGESYTLGEQMQYTDIWVNDNYLQFMFERLALLRELLVDGGALFLHCDCSRGHHLRCLMDEVFGPESFVNEIVWSYRRWPSNTNAFQAMHDTILYYTKEISQRRTFHRGYEEASESYMKRFSGKTQRLDEETRTRKITSEEETKGMPLRDVWDISIIAGFKSERTDYPTQKPEELVERIVATCSNPGDLVLDSFLGSGTTATVAQKLGRRWIGCDINKGAIQTTVKRLRTVIASQIDEARKRAGDERQGKLPGTGDDGEQQPKPAQFGFAVWRVNDYDLNIQHNEAVNLACEHVGVQRTRSDAYFDGTLGKKLVKIIPFGHPLTPLDLEELKRELEARPDEDRAVTLVCLGMELAAKAWVDDWNRMRKGKDAVNRIEVIELRTDAKYGKFIKHEPAKARVKVTRKNAKVLVEVTDFISPTIIERLQQQAGILQPKIEDWRATVDCIMIDPAYNGSVLNVALDDIPGKKDDLVVGKYEIPAPADETTVAVKIIDMLGEEVIVTATV